MLALKLKIKEQLLLKLNNELHALEEAARSSRAYAIQDDLKSEGKYDTRAIEASYLAAAELKRVEELKQDVQMLEDLEVKESNHIELGALAILELNHKEQMMFFSPNLGGEIILIDQQTILIISVFSPIGNEALSLIEDESFEVETPKEIRKYIIKKIF